MWEEMDNDLYVTVMYAKEMTHNGRELTREDRVKILKVLDQMFD